MPKILVVEDNFQLSRLLQLELEHAGYQIKISADGSEAIDDFLAFKPDLLILDVLLPELDGFEVAKIIRSYDQKIGIMMLTALDQKKDKLKGFQTGIDDYLTKPFEMEELKARIQSLLRRMQHDDSQFLEYHELIIDEKTKKVTFREVPLLLTKKEYELLVLFVQNFEKTLSKQTIVEKVWGFDFEGNPTIVEVYVNFLRKKLGEAGEWIITVRGWGYRFERIPHESRH